MTQQADITRAQPDQPAGAQRIVPEDAFVGIPDPDSTGAVGQDMLNAIAERFLGQDMAPGVIDDCVAGQDLGAPLRSGSHQQDVAAGKGCTVKAARPGPVRQATETMSGACTLTRAVTVAATGYQQRPAAARNARAIHANSGHVQPH